MEGFKEDLISKKELLSAPPFPDSEMTKEAIDKRIELSKVDYWYFDKTYFPADMYSGGYFDPSVMHKTIVELSQTNGVHIVFGPRGHGKTVTAKKVLVWLLVTGQIRVAGTYAETIDKAENLMEDIAELISGNDRIVNDYKPEFKIRNSEKIQLRFNGIKDRKWRYVQPFSGKRSVRGYTRLFLRPQIIIGDDVETLESSMDPDIVKHRIDKLSETYQSLAEDSRVFLILANDFSEKSALHRIRVEQDEGILAESWKVHVFQAWDEENNCPMWKEKYKAQTEAELKEELQPKDEQDWQCNFQQNPMAPDGITFSREYYQEWGSLPSDIKAVLYCDPNLALKSKGDTTGITALAFSPETQKFYIVGARCRSFSDSNDLLDGVWSLFINRNVLAIGMDGHVTQESIWSNNVRHWSREKGRPFPKIEYMRLDIDDLAKNVQMAWVTGDILFPPDFAKSAEGKEYVKQLFAFKGKTAKKRDDAPDSMIGAYQLIHIRHFVRRGKNLLAEVLSFVEESIYRF